MASLAKEDWLRAGLLALGELGVAGVAVERLASGLGVTKGSFYHHFSKRQDLLEGILLYWQEVATEQVIEGTDEACGDAVQRLRHLVFQIFSDNHVFDKVEWSIRQWAASSEKAAELVKAVDTRRIDYVRDLLMDAGLPEETSTLHANLLYRALIGDFLWREQGGAAFAKSDLEALVTLLLTRAEGPGPA